MVNIHFNVKVAHSYVMLEVAWLRDSHIGPCSRCWHLGQLTTQQGGGRTRLPQPHLGHAQPQLLEELCSSHFCFPGKS